MTVTTPAMRTAFHLTTVLPMRTVTARPRATQKAQPKPRRQTGLEHVEALHTRIVNLRLAGHTFTEISETIDVALATVTRHLTGKVLILKGAKR